MHNCPPIRGQANTPTDKVSNLLDLTSPNLRLTTEVTSWIQTPIDDAYEIFCQKLDMLCFEDVQHKLTQSKVDGVLDLSRMGMRDPKILEPVFKAIDNNDFIQDVRLAFCKLGKYIFQVNFYKKNLHKSSENVWKRSDFN